MSDLGSKVRPWEKSQTLGENQTWGEKLGLLFTLDAYITFVLKVCSTDSCFFPSVSLHKWRSPRISRLPKLVSLSPFPTAFFSHTLFHTRNYLIFHTLSTDSRSLSILFSHIARSRLKLILANHKLSNIHDNVRYAQVLAEAYTQATKARHDLVRRGVSGNPTTCFTVV
jgi:hypothetical protein